jgi:hypothetical protein
MTNTDGATVISTTLTGVDPAVLQTPQIASGETNAIDVCTDIAANISTDSIAYVGDGSEVCADTGACLQFELQYKKESDGTIQTIGSRRQAALASCGNITDLAAATFSFSQIDLTWTAVCGATSYTVEYATNASFTGSTVLTPSPTSNSASVTGLNIATLYYFRVRPLTATETGSWSNTATATTYSLGTPVPTCTASSMTQIQCTWASITNATSYDLEYATNAAFTGATPVTGATSPYTRSGLSAGTTVYFRVKSVAPGYTSGWSATSSATTILPAPVCNTSTKNDNRQITVSWTASAGAVTYTLDYDSDSTFGSPATITGIATTSRAVGSLNNATTYYFRVKAINGSVMSAWGACPSAATSVDGPITTGWTSRAYGVRNAASISWMPGEYPGSGTWWTNGMYIYGTCQPGATVVTRLYSYYATAGNGSPNGASLLDWTYNNQERYVVGGNNSWYVWWQGWVACQAGSTRAGVTYLGNAGGY